ncbi:hypothetical protein J6590_013950 [Homalodisca vitripennis]|nr:hypothetical protein J6590_013950 [Homalodisca vitripennis]
MKERIIKCRPSVTMIDIWIGRPHTPTPPISTAVVATQLANGPEHTITPPHVCPPSQGWPPYLTPGRGVDALYSYTPQIIAPAATYD